MLRSEYVHLQRREATAKGHPTMAVEFGLPWGNRTDDPFGGGAGAIVTVAKSEVYISRDGDNLIEGDDALNFVIDTLTARGDNGAPHFLALPRRSQLDALANVLRRRGKHAARRKLLIFANSPLAQRVFVVPELMERIFFAPHNIRTDDYKPWAKAFGIPAGSPTEVMADLVDLIYTNSSRRTTPQSMVIKSRMAKAESDLATTADTRAEYEGANLLHTLATFYVDSDTKGRAMSALAGDSNAIVDWTSQRERTFLIRPPFKIREGKMITFLHSNSVGDIGNSHIVSDVRPYDGDLYEVKVTQTGSSPAGTHIIQSPFLSPTFIPRSPWTHPNNPRPAIVREVDTPLSVIFNGQSA